MTRYPRGSEWRRWDLHFHTPSSYDVSNNVTNEQIVDVWKNNNISVVAITDHHEIDIQRYRRLSELAAKENIKVLPGIEFLSDARGSEPIHFIGIFSEKSDIEYIWGQLSNITSIKDIKGINKKHNEIYCDLSDTIKIVKELGGIVTIHAGKKSNSMENITHSLPHGDAQKKDIANIIDIFEMGKAEDVEAYRKFVFTDIGFEIPMIMCSDNHDINHYTFKEKCWIKADPTFKGLKQATIEPDRIYIGEIPPSITRIEKNKTKTLDNLLINWEKEYMGQSGTWFKDVVIPFNPEMTVVIGNKGSGKTAIAEITALACNSKNEESFIFLEKSKFRLKKLANNFTTTVNWYKNVNSATINLGSNIDENMDEFVHFVPQRSFEKLCNEIDDSFSKEINEVVFSRLEEHVKLGYGSFEELIKSKLEVINNDKNSIKSKIEQLNIDLKEIEEKRNSNYKKSLESTLKTVVLEHTAHQEIKPVEVLPPKELNTEEYKGWISILEKDKGELEQLKNEYNSQYICLEELKKLKQKISSFENYFTEFISENDEDFEKYELSLKDIITITTKHDSIDFKINEVNTGMTEILSKIGESSEPKGILLLKIEETEDKIKKYDDENQGKLKEYQKYLQNIGEWNIKNKDLENKIDKWKKDIEYIGDFSHSQIASDINNLRNERLKLTKNLFEKIKEVIQIYDEYKKPITDFILTYKEQIDKYSIEINTGIFTQNDFVKNFVDNYINSVRNSNFKAPEGTKLLQEMVDNADFNKWDDLENFLVELLNKIDDNPKENFYDKFKNNKDIEFLNNIFYLSFLKPEYSLQLYGKPLDELSPGERGSLLLVFYLLLDKRDIPLILDQPEDNLDNESVANILVPFIRDAKKRRQIIIITHNANLAVVADAEQVIRVKIDKHDRNKFTYESGSLESEIIDDVVNVLEGTENSFDKRKSKYAIKKC